ncbi:MAG: hypothetical protein GY851_25565 [bacterium]|nr:hypothetical protein [bacterium]
MKLGSAAAIAVAFILIGTAHSQATDAPLNIGSGKQLFLGPWADDGRDDYLVESMAGIEMTMNEARVTGERLIVQDKPWEGAGILDMRQFVLKDGDRFRMYYSALPFHKVVADMTKKQPAANLWKRPYQRILCYAESADGIHWEKPNLGLCEWEGARENNILFPNDTFDYVFSEMEGASVFIDPVATSPETKYKMFVKISPVGKGGTEDKGPIPVVGEKALKKGQYAFGSPDGIHWTLLKPEKVNPGHDDTQFSVFWDECIGKYVQYTRIKVRNEPQVAHYKALYGDKGRDTDLHVGRAVSDDFLNWGPETTVLAPDEKDRAGAPEGVTPIDFYGGNMSRYDEAPNAYIGLPNAYYHWALDPVRKWWSGKRVQLPGTLDVQLVTSRDGIHWHRTPKRKPFIRVGPEGTFWSKTLWPDGNAIRVGDELWFYFAGLDVSHKEQSLLPSSGARGRAVLRLDGFISANAAYTGGELVTRPLVFDGGCLQLNMDAGAGGTVEVCVLDEDGEPIPGFTVNDADALTGNSVGAVATWNGDPDVSALAGRTVKLRFLMRDAGLYSFQFYPPLSE